MKRAACLIMLSMIIFLCLSQIAGALESETITVDNESKSVYKVSDGFYQDGETYTASTNFYINSKLGLEYFQKLVNAADSSTIAETYCSTFYSNNITSWYQTNIFTDKTVHLLADIDLNNVDWTPIGYVGANSNYEKTYFYGNFDGHNHTISNLNLVPTNGTSYNEVGLFGRIQYSNSFKDITLNNVKANGVRVGALVGFTHSNFTNTFTNCHVTGSISINGQYNGNKDAAAGGLVGQGYTLIFDNCSIKGDGNSNIIGTKNGDHLCFVGYFVGAGDYATTFKDCSVSGVTAEKDGVEITKKNGISVAMIGETEYADLKKAVEAAYTGNKTVKFLQDIEIDTWTQNAGVNYTTGPTGLTIEGDNHKLTIKNIESKKNGNRILYGATNLTVQNLSIDLSETSNCTGFSFNSGTIDNVNFTGGVFALFVATNVNADDIVIQDCTFTKQSSCALYFEDKETPVANKKIILANNTFDECGRVGVLYNAPVKFYGNIVKENVKSKTNFHGVGSEIAGNYFGNMVKFYHTDTTAYYNQFLGQIELENEIVDNKEKSFDLSGNYWSESGYDSDNKFINAKDEAITFDQTNVLVDGYYTSASEEETTLDGIDYAIPFTLYPAFIKPTVVESFTYDGLSHNLVNNDGVTTEGKFYFALGENATTAPSDGSYSSDFPKGTAANTYYIWYRVVGPYSKTDGEFLGSVVIQSVPNDSGGGSVIVNDDNESGNNSNGDNSSDNNSNNNGNGDSNNNNSSQQEQEINEVVNNVVENMSSEEKETITNINEVLTDEQKTTINDNQLQAIVNELDNLETLDLAGNQNITTVDLSGKENLTSVNLENCDNLQALDVSGCSSLVEVEGISNNTNITNLNASGCENLQTLDVSGCEKLETLDVSGCSSLTELEGLNNTSITKLDASGCENLETLDVSGCENLETLDCSDSALNDLKVENCPSLQELKCSNNNIESLSVANCEVLETLDCSKNSIANLTVQGCLNLKRLYCYSNNLEKLELPVQRLEWLVCDNNKLQELNVEENRRLQRLDCQNNGMGALEIDRTVFKDLNWLKCYGQKISDLNVLRNGNNYQVRINDYIRSYSPTFASAGAIVSEVDVNNVVDVKGFDKNGNEIEKISYDEATGIVEFAESPAKVSYSYKTGYNDIVMDVTLGEETRERNSNASDDDNKDNNTAYYGGGSSGCNMGISVIALAACAMFLKKAGK